VVGLDGKKYIEPEMHDICACKDKVHYEAVEGFPVPDCPLCQVTGEHAGTVCRCVDSGSPKS
jgi:hypothetical protein